MDSNEPTGRVPESRSPPNVESTGPQWDWSDESFDVAWLLEDFGALASVEQLKVATRPAQYTLSTSPQQDPNPHLVWLDHPKAEPTPGSLVLDGLSSGIQGPHGQTNEQNQTPHQPWSATSGMSLSSWATTDVGIARSPDDVPYSDGVQQNISSPSTTYALRSEYDSTPTTNQPTDETRLRAQRIWQSSPSRRRDHAWSDPYPVATRSRPNSTPTQSTTSHTLIENYIAKRKHKCFRPDGRRNIIPLRGIYPCTAPCGWSTSRPHDWRRHEESRQPQTFFVCEPCVDLTAIRGGEPFINHRMDKLKEHLAKVHGAKEVEGGKIAERCRVEYVAPFERMCPVRGCEVGFETWEERVAHVMDHFR